MASTGDFHGKWALVTGASAGIGVALARELAGYGANLILTARRKERLEALVAELSAKGAQTRIIVADLNDPAAPQQIYDATEGDCLPVDILINNAGLGHYGAFDTIEPKQELSQVRVNCDAVVALSRLFVPRMVERRRGWVLIVSSLASFQPIPYHTTYAATKVFDRFFALGLAAEVEHFGIKVTALCPGPTESEFGAVAGSPASFRRYGSQSAQEVARKGLDALARGKRTIVPSFKGSFVPFLVRLLPVNFVIRVLEKALRPKQRQGT